MTKSPTPPLTTEVYRVKFKGGPLDGHTKEYPSEHPTYRILDWEYENTNRRDGDYWVYVLIPRGRANRRILNYMMEATSHDPRLADANVPIKHTHRGRNALCHCGSGKKYKRCHGG